MMQQRAAGDQLLLIMSQKSSCVHKLLVLSSLQHFISQKNQVCWVKLRFLHVYE